MFSEPKLTSFTLHFIRNGPLSACCNYQQTQMMQLTWVFHQVVIPLVIATGVYHQAGIGPVMVI